MAIRPNIGRSPKLLTTENSFRYLFLTFGAPHSFDKVHSEPRQTLETQNVPISQAKRTHNGGAGLLASSRSAVSLWSAHVKRKVSK